MIARPGVPSRAHTVELHAFRANGNGQTGGCGFLTQVFPTSSSWGVPRRPLQHSINTRPLSTGRHRDWLNPRPSPTTSSAPPVVPPLPHLDSSVGLVVWTCADRKLHWIHRLPPTQRRLTHDRRLVNRREDPSCQSAHPQLDMRATQASLFFRHNKVQVAHLMLRARLQQGAGLRSRGVCLLP